jgi:hypothetical protein
MLIMMKTICLNCPSNSALNPSIPKVIAWRVSGRQSLQVSSLLTSSPDEVSNHHMNSIIHWSRQLCFGQVPARLFFADWVKPRETVSSGLEYDRLKNLILDAENIDLEGWIISSFTTRPSNSGGQNGVFTSSVHRLRHIASNLTLTSLGRMMR